MRPSPQDYFPVSPLFLVLFLLGFALLVTLIEFNVLTYAYEKMGISRRYVFSILLFSLLGREHAAPIAYVAGSMGTLLGADIFNLHRLQELGAPVASIGGAGISDGIFMTGIIAVLLA